MKYVQKKGNSDAERGIGRTREKEDGFKKAESREGKFDKGNTREREPKPAERARPKDKDSNEPIKDVI